MAELRRFNQSVDQRIVRQLNKDVILDIIRRAPEGISRAEIAQALGVSRSTVSAIVDGFIASKLVIERGTGISRGGRRPIVLEINPDAGRVIGVDIGATHLAVIVADLRGQILAEVVTPLAIERGPEKSLEAVHAGVENALSKADSRLDAVKAIGVGVPGPVIKDLGIVSAPPIMPGWDGFPIRQRLEDHWRRPTTLDNDADLGALGEYTFGGGRGEANLVYIKIGTGIGSGILLDGHIYHGVLGTAGEIGHVTISQDGPPCTCGNYGCLEAMAGGRAIAQRAQMAVKAGQRTSLAAINGGREITARDVGEAARAGDVVSQQLLADAGRYIGSAVASLVNLLNPSLVLLGGGVIEAGDILLDPIRQAVRERTLHFSVQATRIEVAALGMRATALGAVALALAKTFESFVALNDRAPMRA